MLIVVFFTIAERCEQLDGQSMNEWIKKVYIYFIYIFR